jgi:hypothetical protein
MSANPIKFFRSTVLPNAWEPNAVYYITNVAGDALVDVIVTNGSGLPVPKYLGLTIDRKINAALANLASGDAFPITLAAKVWTIAHNLNRYPSVTTTDNLGNVIHGDVTYIDANIVQIKHGNPIIGFAYLN